MKRAKVQAAGYVRDKTKKKNPVSICSENERKSGCKAYDKG